MRNTTRITVVLGDEFDEALRVKLMDALRQLGATAVRPADRSVAGSQDLEEFEVILNEQLLRIEAETYVGLSINGPSDLVQQVQQLVSQ